MPTGADAVLYPSFFVATFPLSKLLKGLPINNSGRCYECCRLLGGLLFSLSVPERAANSGQCC